MSRQSYQYQQRNEPRWFTRARKTFGALIYNTSIEVLGIDTYRKYAVSNNRLLLDYCQKSFVKWK